MCAELSSCASRRLRRERGVSLVELMVGIVVALLVGIAATGAAVFFNASQKQGMGTGGVSINTTTALSAIKEDMSQMGLGFFGDSSYLCDHLNLSVGGNDFSQDNFAPLQVVRSGNFDRVDIVYANAVAGGANVRLHSPTTAASAAVKSFLPAASGVAVVFAGQPGPTNRRCTVRTVTGTTPAANPSTPQVIDYASTGSHNQFAFASPVTYVIDDRVSLLGSLAWQRYAVNADGHLTLTRRFDGTSAILVRDVVAFKVRYGITSGAANENSITSWVEPTGAWAALGPANIARVRAIQVGIVTRSPQREPRDAGGNCVASHETPSVLGAAVSIATWPSDWACFRYRTATVTVPMRNVALGLSS